MKKDVIISEEANGEYTVVTIKKLFENKTTQYKYKTANKYESPYLSLENLSYHISLRNEDETDDYLLNHALQENKKLCVSFFTNTPEVIENVFNNHERYSVLIRETGKPDLSKLAVVSRKGCLKDYFDMDDIVDWYERQGITVVDSILESMMDEEMITLLSGEYEHPVVKAKYDFIIRFEGDEVLQNLKAEGLIVTGLLLGYPLESTADLIKEVVDPFSRREFW